MVTSPEAGYKQQYSSGRCRLPPGGFSFKSVHVITKVRISSRKNICFMKYELVNSFGFI